MKIYLIKLMNSEEQYDCYLGHVIVANSELEVRQLAEDERAPFEASGRWVESNDNCIISTISDYTGNESLPFIILSAFNAG